MSVSRLSKWQETIRVPIATSVTAWALYSHKAAGYEMWNRRRFWDGTGRQPRRVRRWRVQADCSRHEQQRPENLSRADRRKLPEVMDEVRECAWQSSWMFGVSAVRRGVMSLWCDLTSTWHQTRRAVSDRSAAHTQIPLPSSVTDISHLQTHPHLHIYTVHRQNSDMTPFWYFVSPWQR